MRSVMFASALGILVGLMAHTFGSLVIVLGLMLVVAGILLTLTAIGAVIGIPLGLLGGVAIALGAASAGGIVPSVLLGLVAALFAHRRLERGHALAIHP